MKPPQARLRLLDLNLPLHSPTKRPLSSGLFFVDARAPSPVAAAIGFFDHKKPAPDGVLAWFLAHEKGHRCCRWPLADATEVTDQAPTNMRAGFSIQSLMRIRKLTASLPSTTR